MSGAGMDWDEFEELETAETRTARWVEQESAVLDGLDARRAASPLPNAHGQVRLSPLQINPDHSVYAAARDAMERRPDFAQIERVWSVLSVEHADTPVVEMEIGDLADRAECPKEAVVSHLRTLSGCGFLAALVFVPSFAAFSVVASRHVRAPL